MLKTKVTLSDGKSVEIDISTMKQSEWRDLFDPQVDDAKTDAALARWTGLKPKDFGDMNRQDFRLIISKILILGNSPLAAPNSQSASTSD